MGCHFLLQGIFLTQGFNLGLLRWQVDSLPLSHKGSFSGILGLPHFLEFHTVSGTLINNVYKPNKNFKALASLDSISYVINVLIDCLIWK